MKQFFNNTANRKSEATFTVIFIRADSYLLSIQAIYYVKFAEKLH